MAYDKRKSRKYRLAPEDNYKLDKIRLPGEGSEKQKSLLNVWSVIVVSAALMLIAFVIPKTVSFFKERQRNDAFKWTKDTVQILRKATMSEGAIVDDGTIFVSERNGKYYIFWYYAAAPDEQAHLVEINDPLEFAMPINVRKGMELAYPFSSPPLEKVGNSVTLLEGLDVLDGYRIEKYDSNQELNNEKIDGVDVYLLKRINN